MIPSLFKPNHQIQRLRAEENSLITLLSSFAFPKRPLFLLYLLEERKPGRSQEANTIPLGTLV